MVQSGLVIIEACSNNIFDNTSFDHQHEWKTCHSLIKTILESLDSLPVVQSEFKLIYAFATPNKAVDGALRILEELIEFDKGCQASKAFVWPIQIGIHTFQRGLFDEINLDEKDCNTLLHESIRFAEEIKSLCPFTRILISKNVFDALELKKRLFRPFESGNKKQLFILSDRLIMPQESCFMEGLTRKQKMAIPYISCANWSSIKPDEGTGLTALSDFFRQPILVILGETSPSPGGPISSTATSDAVGLIEILCALDCNKDLKVGLDHWEDTADEVLNRNIIIIGSGMVNTYAFALNDIFQPAHFVKTQGRCLDQIIATSQNGEFHFGSHALPPKNSSLILFSKNPFNPKRNLLWIAGITGIATQAAYNCLRDLIFNPLAISERKIIQGNGTSVIQTFPSACVVGPSTGKADFEWTISDYYGRLRIPSYELLWMVDRNGQEI
ncbi:MAG: hypothetical protein F6K19_17665 [Cyanothece sp. SIO1E1]|nr:hypothetical protein [Cyanothece sp. SIO1E1]